MTTEVWIALLGAFGISGVVPLIVTYILKQRDAKITRQEEASKATVEDSAQMRGELWQQLQTALARNDALAQQRGQLYQEKAEAIALADAKQRQVDDLMNRYTTVAQKLEDAEYRRRQQEERYEKQIEERDTEKAQLERDKAALERRILDLEHDIARITRGGPSRATDLDDPPQLRTPARLRRATDQLMENNNGRTNDSRAAPADTGSAPGSSDGSESSARADERPNGGEEPGAGAGGDGGIEGIDRRHG